VTGQLQSSFKRRCSGAEANQLQRLRNFWTFGVTNGDLDSIYGCPAFRDPLLIPAPKGLTTYVTWQAIVDEHGEAVFRVAFRLLHNVHDAEDVSQEVLLEAYRMPQPPGAALLMRMAAFRAIDRLRQRIPAIPFDEQVCLVGGRSSEQESESAEEAELLRTAIAQLPRQQSTCFWLRYVENLSNQEIAELQSISVSAVSTALNKARRNLSRFFLSKTEKSHD
jgi:RNA polymerase sigma-70 factor (ECF subfamily)